LLSKTISIEDQDGVNDSKSKDKIQCNNVGANREGFGPKKTKKKREESCQMRGQRRQRNTGNKNNNFRGAKQAGISGPDRLGKKSNLENHCLAPAHMEIP